MLAHAQDSAKPAAKAAESITWLQLEVGPHKVKAELAATDAQRSRGLMFRESMPKEQGMVFIFDEPGYHSMWMQNTLIPLAVAFVDGDGKILNIREMQPKTQDLHTADGPARYALEMNGKWFAEKGIKAGDRIKGLPPPPKR
jgi:hypothetical protein